MTQNFFIRAARLFTLVVVSCLVLLADATAQARDNVVVAPVFRTRTVPGGRIDVATGLYRSKSVFREKYNGRVDRILSDVAEEFGWSENLSELELIKDHRLSGSRHVTFQQEIDGIPVEGRLIKVNLNAMGEPTAIVSGFEPIMAGVPIDRIPQILPGDAVDAAMAVVSSNGGKSAEPELVYIGGKRPRLAWKIIIWSADTPSEWITFVDALSGKVLSAVDQSFSVHGRKGANLKAPPDPLRRAFGGSQGGKSPTLPGNESRIQGSGFVFDPDPMTTAGVMYGAPYVDANDAAVPELDAERVLVQLNDISINNSGNYVLEGPFVQIVGENQLGTVTYTPPQGSTPDDFRFSRSDDGFEAVNAYYHIDKSQRYVQSLGITDIQNRSFRINPLGLSADDSFFFPSADLIVFGSGKVDDAEDASVLWHEYAHALLDEVVPGLATSTIESRSFHEGWADYWAASYGRSLVEQGLVARQDWERLFKWDSGDGSIWEGRELNDFDHYPEGVCSAQGNGPCSIHDDGRLWATTMMEVYSALGRETTDFLSIRSHAYLQVPVTFAIAAEAVIQADLDYFNGAHLDALIQIFGDRGLIDVSTLGPVVHHVPIAWSENLGGVQPIEVEAKGISDDIAQVQVFYRWGNGLWNSAPLASAGNDVYTGNIPIPSEPGLISYYVQASDAGARVSTLPERAPHSSFLVSVGPDNEAPTIGHQPIENTNIATWPVLLETTVTDNLGVASVVVDYTIESSSSEELASGMFNLTQSGDDWSGYFPVGIEIVEVDSKVFYSLRARDLSIAENESALPSGGSYSFNVISNGLISSFSFENPESDITYSGAFERGAPLFVLKTAHSGSSVAGTSLGMPYPETAGLSTIDLPTMNLIGIDEPLLVFWHWFDTEHDGSADPASSSAVLFDGGNMVVSVDDGNTWTILVPEHGYSGSVTTSNDNPLSGEPAFGGYSYGWRQVIAPLPVSASVQIQFRFGTDAGNVGESISYTGWYVDDVRITSVRPEDAELPEAQITPESVTVLPIHSSRPMIEFRITDDNGVEDVFADYEFFAAGSSQAASQSLTGTVRLQMDLSKLTFYQGQFDFLDDPAASDRLTYTVRAVDYSGNQTVVTTPDGLPFVIEYQVIEEVDGLSSVVGTGLWRQVGMGWVTKRDTSGQYSDKPAVSSINLIPMDIASNAAGSVLKLSHAYQVFDGSGGNLKISVDAGRSWRLLKPEGGYDSVLSLPDDHAMDGEPGFSGNQETIEEIIFSLTEFAGQQIRVRLDFGTTRELFISERWEVASIRIIQSTGEDDFVVERALQLHPNYPNPFQTATRISYTLEMPGDVSLTMYDMTGRRVRTISSGFQDAGTYEITVYAGNLASGMYMLRLISSGSVANRAVIIHR